MLTAGQYNNIVDIDFGMMFFSLFQIVSNIPIHIIIDSKCGRKRNPISEKILGSNNRYWPIGRECRSCASAIGKSNSSFNDQFTSK